MRYAIGLDIGIASVGFAAVGLNGQDEPSGILRMGSRVFDKAEQPKTGESLAAPRRQARSLRRRLRRRKHRRERIRALLVRAGLLTREQLDGLFLAADLEDVYALRTRALDERVSAAEFARVLLHLAQRRGFKSNRRGDAGDKEQGLLLKAVEENRARMEKNGYRTVGEMLFKDAFFADHKRNKGENYLSTVQREMVSDEAARLFEAQRSLGAAWATPELEAEYLDILLSQRSFDEGPGGNSPYGGNRIEAMVGECALEKGEKRAPRGSFSFEWFAFLEKLNHVRLEQEGKSRPLTPEERARAQALALRTPELTYAKLRKELDLPENARFNMLRYRTDKTPAETEKEKLNVLRGYHEMRKALDKVKKGRITEISVPQRDGIARAFAFYKTEERLREALAPLGLTDYDVEALLAMASTPFSKFGHLSAKACQKLTPYLEQGSNYNEACDAAGYDFKGHSGFQKSKTLPAAAPEMENITSPVVRRAVAQTIKVVNALIRELGDSPVYLNIELAREMSKTFEERNKLDKQMQENGKNNERIMNYLHNELGLAAPTGQDLVKYRLWEEQTGLCAYSLRPIPLEQLFRPGVAEVDHIVPYSISFDDSRSNKVLVLCAENRQKGNRLPLQYMQGKQREDFIVWTRNNVKQYRKRQNLLRESLSDNERDGFRERNLQDTKHMAAFLYNYITDHLEFAPSATGKKRRVMAVNGAVTSHMRKRWGLTKVRADGDIHHALDAVVIACTTQKMINEVSGYYDREEKRYVQSEDGSYSVHAKTGEVFPAPWPHFRDDLATRLGSDNKGYMTVGEALADLQGRGLLPSYDALPELDLAKVRPIFVSRMPRRKVTGAAHKETVKSPKALQEGYTLQKQPLTALKLDKEGELEGYYKPSSDTLLYEALKARLLQFGGDGKKAFAQPFHKPKSDGTPGPLVKKVKLLSKSTLNVPVHGGLGVADNDSMVRIDLFRVEGDGYYLVPVYVADTLKKELPNRAVVAHKPYAEWKEMEDRDFVFSLYPNDLIRVESKREMKFSLNNAESTREKEFCSKAEFCYYCGADIAAGAIKVITNDNCYFLRGLGIKTLQSITKYQVDVLGNVTPAGREPRQPFHLGK